MSASYVPSARISPRSAARLYHLLTDDELRALCHWHAEWVVADGEYVLGDWPGWADVAARLQITPEPAVEEGES